MLSESTGCWLMKLVIAGHLPPVTAESPPPCLFLWGWNIMSYTILQLHYSLIDHFLSCCDQINLDGSETMNDDITIWVLATCRSKNQLVFGQSKRLHSEASVVWRDTPEFTGYWDSSAEDIIVATLLKNMLSNLLTVQFTVSYAVVERLFSSECVFIFLG